MAGTWSLACCSKVLEHFHDDATARSFPYFQAITYERTHQLMNPQDAIDLGREAIKTCMMVGGPILVISLLIGLLVGIFQAMTQVQDQTVSFVPKILLLIVAIGACLPWLTDQMIDFARYSFEKPYAQSSYATSVNNFVTPTSPSGPKMSIPAADNAPSPTPRQLPSHQVQPPRTTVPSLVHPPTQSNSQSESPQDDAELKSPFILPHYRFSRVPQTDNGG